MLLHSSHGGPHLLQEVRGAEALGIVRHVRRVRLLRTWNRLDNVGRVERGGVALHPRTRQRNKETRRSAKNRPLFWNRTKREGMEALKEECDSAPTRSTRRGRTEKQQSS